MQNFSGTLESTNTSFLAEEIDSGVSSTPLSTFTNQSYPLGKNLLIVDPSVKEYQALVNAAAKDVDVFILDDNQNGIFQISSILSNYSAFGVSSLHLVTHGSGGEVFFGQTSLNSNNISNYRDELTGWSEYLSDAADILLYGCNVADSSVGLMFIDKLSSLTRADVAASTNLTGSNLLGGDWDLEVATGDIEAISPFEGGMLSEFSSLLHEGHFHNDYIVDTDPNFQNELLISGLIEPIAMETLPDGRMLILQKGGGIKLVDPRLSIPTVSDYLTITNINAGSERGLLDIALDPDFAVNNQFYVYYSDSNRRFRISRFTHEGSTANIASEQVIWQQPEISGNAAHHGGGLDFGPDGKLYLSVGEQFDEAAAQDLTTTKGKILRINKDGTVPQDNPFVDGPGGNLDEIWAYGLRNPWRAVWDIPTNRLFISDVGGNDERAREEINIAQAGGNHGWDANETQGITGIPGLVDPILAYDHSLTGSGAATGGLVYRDNYYPSQFNGAYFFGDYAQRWIRYLTFDQNGNVIDAEPETPDTIEAFNFVQNAGRVVAFAVGTEGALYYLDIYQNPTALGALRRITFAGGGDNQSPIINQASASQSSGIGPLTVQFTSSASDPEGDTLTYLWDFGNGTQATGASVEYTFETNGLYNVSLVVSDGTNSTLLAEPLTITVGTPPSASILSPIGGNFFKAGDVITLEATGTDPDGVLTASNFEWEVRFIHNDHFHPELSGVTGTNQTFTVETTGHGFSGSTGYEIILTVTDSDGLRDTESILIYPEKVDLTFSSDVPGGVEFTLDGSQQGSSFTIDTAINFEHTVTVPLSTISNGFMYTFAGWSDGASTATRTLTVPEFNQSYSANYIVSNTLPSASNDTAVTVQDSPIDIAVLSNDIDADGDDLNLTIAAPPTRGIVVINNNGTPSDPNDDFITYTPNPNFSGTDTFTYQIDDGRGGVDQAIVTVSVTSSGGGSSGTLPVSDGLVLHLDAGSGVTTNGTDLVTGWEDLSGFNNNLTGSGDPRLITGALNGRNVIQLDGDGDKLERVLNLNGLPSGDADRTVFMVTKYNSIGYGGFAYGKNSTNQAFGLTVKNDGDLMVQAWGKNDADSNIDGTGAGWLTQSVVLNAGSMNHYKDGSLIDSRALSYNTFLERIVLGAEIDSSPYVNMEVAEILVFDRALSETERQQVETYFQQKYFNATPTINQPPVAVADGFSIQTNSVNNVLNVLANDGDPDADLLSIIEVSSPNNGGLVTINSTGNGLIYTPQPNFEGAESFTYTISDSRGGTSTATVTAEVIVLGNTAPIANNDVATTVQNSPINIAVLANDTDADGDALLLSVATSPMNGTLLINNNGTPSDPNDDFITYTPNPNFSGTDTFTYQIDDGRGGVDQAIVTVSVTSSGGGSSGTLPVSDGLVLHLDAGSGVTTNGTDLVTGWEDLSGFNNNLTGSGDPRLITGALNGRNVIQLDGDGDKLERVLNLNGLPSGDADRTVFMVTKYNSIGYGGFAYGKNSTNQAFGLTVKNDGDLMVQAWGKNDADSNIDGTGAGWLTQSVVLNAGSMNHYKDGSLIDSRALSYNTFLERIVLGAEIDSSPYVNMEVAEILVFDRALSETERQQVETYFQQKYFGSPSGGSNTVPVAGDDIATTSQDTPIDIAVLVNDSDADGDALTLSIEIAPTNGAVVINDNDTPGNFSDDFITYLPNAGFSGTDMFTYQVNDGNGGIDQATVIVNVTESNGGGEEILPVTSGLVLQLDAGAGVTTDGNDLIIGWADQSELGNDLVAFGDPRLLAGVLNGKNVIQLDGDGDKLERVLNLNGLPSGNADRTVFMVAKYNSIGYGGFAYGNNFNNEAFGLLVKNDGDLLVQAWGKSDADSNVDGTGAGWLTQSAVLSAGNMSHYKDGLLIDNRTIIYNTLLEKIVLGADLDSNPYVNMEVAEILIFDRALSGTERQQVEDYFKRKYFSIS